MSFANAIPYCRHQGNTCGKQPLENPFSCWLLTSVLIFGYMLLRRRVLQGHWSPSTFQKIVICRILRLRAIQISSQDCGQLLEGQSFVFSALRLGGFRKQLVGLLRYLILKNLNKFFLLLQSLSRPVKLTPQLSHVVLFWLKLMTTTFR